MGRAGRCGRRLPVRVRGGVPHAPDRGRRDRRGRPAAHRAGGVPGRGGVAPPPGRGTVGPLPRPAVRTRAVPAGEEGRADGLAGTRARVLRAEDVRPVDRRRPSSTNSPSSTGAAMPGAASSNPARSENRSDDRKPLTQGPQPAQHPRWRRPAAKRLGGLELQGHAGEGAVEAVLVDHAPAAAGIVDEVASLSDPLQHHEVPEFPEQYGRQRKAGEVSDLLPPARRLEPVPPRRARDVGRRTAVAAVGARLAHLLKRHPASEMAEHRGKTGGAAFGRLDPKHQRRAHAAREQAPQPIAQAVSANGHR